MTELAEVTAAGHTFIIRTDGDRVSIDGDDVIVSLVKVGAHHYSLLIDSVSYDLVAKSDGASTLVSIDGTPLVVRTSDTRSRLLEEFGPGANAQMSVQSMHAPMPGLVLHINVQEGDTVTTGQGMLVLEAMKMENELRAPADSVVRRIHIREGEAVAKDELLIDLGPCPTDA